MQEMQNPRKSLSLPKLAEIYFYMMNMAGTIFGNFSCCVSLLWVRIIYRTAKIATMKHGDIKFCRNLRLNLFHLYLLELSSMTILSGSGK